MAFHIFFCILLSSFVGQFLKSFFHEIHETDQKEIKQKEAAFSDSLFVFLSALPPRK